MSTNYVVPTADSVKTLLAMLYGAELGANSCANDQVNGRRLATFVDDEDKLVATCVCDQAFIAYSGAALSRIPKSAAEDMVTSNELSDAISRIFYEVMNMCSTLLMSDNSGHLKLAKTVDFEQAEDIVAAINGSENQPGFEVTIPGYGNGKLAFYLH